jgi:hypothetical protein
MSIDASHAHAFTLSIDARGHLEFIDGQGQVHKDATAVRAFPMTAPDKWVSIRDPKGQELALVKDPAMLPTSVRTVLEDELSRTEFSPIVRRIYEIRRAEYGVIWDVETDRGRVEFQLETEESIRSLGDRSAVIIDSHGIRYRIPDILELDRVSRRKLERYF